MMIRFAEFGNQHQELLMGRPFIGDHDHLENQGQRPGKITPLTSDQTVTDMMIRFVEFGSPYQGQQKVWPFVGRYHHMENHGQ